MTISISTPTARAARVRDDSRSAEATHEAVEAAGGVVVDLDRARRCREVGIPFSYAQVTAPRAAAAQGEIRRAGDQGRAVALAATGLVGALLMVVLLCWAALEGLLLLGRALL